MKERNYNQITVTCDSCGESETHNAKPYKELNDELKQSGWVVVKDGDEWLDFCNKDCEEEYFR